VSPSSEFEPVAVATTTPLLRVVLVLLLMLTVLAGLLVTSDLPIGWLTLVFVVVAGPVAVLVEGRSRSRAERSATPRSSREPARRSSVELSTAHYEAA
jgi:hypothetical protein